MNRKHIEEAVRQIEDDMVNDGLLERIGDDRIQLTPKGVEYINKKYEEIDQAVQSAKTTKERFGKLQERADEIL